MLTSTEVKKGKQFWNWFEENLLPYEFLVEMNPAQRGKMISQINEQVAFFCESLSVSIGPHMNTAGGFAIIITANGDTIFFQKAKDLVALAPTIPNWTIYALTPPLPKSLKIRFQMEGLTLDPDDIWVVLADVKGYPNHLAVLVAIEAFDKEKVEFMARLRDTIAKLMSNVIGEESVGINVQFMELAPLPPNPYETGYRTLYELPELIAEYRMDHPSPILIGQK